jgi:hypothetical protein
MFLVPALASSGTHLNDHTNKWPMLDHLILNQFVCPTNQLDTQNHNKTMFVDIAQRITHQIFDRGLCSRIGDVSPVIKNCHIEEDPNSMVDNNHYQPLSIEHMTVVMLQQRHM